MRKHNKKVLDTLSGELRTHLDSLESWFDYLVDYRDALAHRIPLYIPPGSLQPKYHAKAQDLEERKPPRSMRYGQRLNAEQSKLFMFQPLIGHSFTEMPAPIAFHP